MVTIVGPGDSASRQLPGIDPVIFSFDITPFRPRTAAPGVVVGRTNR